MGVRPSFNLLSVVSNIERHNLASDEPFLLLMDLAWPPNVPQAQQSHVRFVRDLNPITYDAGDGNGPQLYTPFNFMMGDLKVSTDGTVPDLELQASNVMLALQQTIEQYAGVVGASLDLYVVNPVNPAGEPELALSFTVKQTTSDLKLVHFKLGASSPIRRLFPIAMYRPNYCIWQYNSPALQQANAALVAAGTPAKDPLGAQCGYQGLSFTGTLTAGSVTIAGVPSAIVAQLNDDFAIWGPGIPAGATFAGASGTAVTFAVPGSGSGPSLSAGATSSGSVTVQAALNTCTHTIDGPLGCEAHNNLVRIGTYPGIDTNGAATASVS